MNDDWTKDIQHLMSDYEAKAPEGLLDDIKKEMARRGNFAQVSPKESVEAKPMQKKSRVVPLWRYRWIAAAAAVAIIAVPVVWKLVPKANEEVAMQERHALPSERAERPYQNDNNSASSSNSILAKISAIVSSKRPDANVAFSGADGHKGRPCTGVGAVSDVLQGRPLWPSADASNADAPAINENENQKGTTDKTKFTSKQQPRKYHPYPEDNYDYFSTEKHSNHGMTLTAYYGGSTGTASTTGMGGPYVAMADFSDAEPIGMYPIEMSGANSAGFIADKAPKRKAHHKQPIKVGVSVGYRLNDRWSVNTGITYSYLSSDFTADNLPTESQKLHYVGIPVTASYSVVKSRKAEVYVSGGGEVEKLVKGTKSTEDYEDEKVKEHRPQWSVKAAVGGAYHFTPTLSVYAEPGVSYHFDNHSAVDNVYKDRKTSFSLNVGLRVNLNK